MLYPHMKNYTINLLLILVTLKPIYALNTEQLQQQADTSLTKLYQHLSQDKINTMPERIDWISKQFLNTTYVLGALGEGSPAHFDQYPLYRTDGFDCDTYVNTVLAIALAGSVNDFHQCMQTLRYENGVIDYLTRNHFTSLDWNINNQERHILKDITDSIVDKHQHSLAIMSKTQINKPGWYAHKGLNTIRLNNTNRVTQVKRLKELKKQGEKLSIATAYIPYLPFSALFSADNQAKMEVFEQIPHGAVIEILRPNWDLRKQIGTYLDVSHLGFAIWSGKTLYFRQASSQKGKVVDIPMVEYLKLAMQSPTIKGVNVQIVLPKKPSIINCSNAFNKTT